MPVALGTRAPKLPAATVPKRSLALSLAFFLSGAGRHSRPEMAPMTFDPMTSNSRNRRFKSEYCPAMTGSGQLPWGSPFSRLVVAGVVSPLGDAMATLALILYVQQTANTGTAVGLLLLSGSAGPLLAPLMGVVADRVDRRVVLVTCAAGQAVVVGLMAGLLPSWQVLLAFVFAGSLLATAQQPAFQAVLPSLVEDQGLPRANALLAGGREFGSVLAHHSPVCSTH